jgi:hypothetical protein
MFGSRSSVFQQIELLKYGFTGNAGMGEDWHIGRNLCAANGANGAELNLSEALD